MNILHWYIMNNFLIGCAEFRVVHNKGCFQKTFPSNFQWLFWILWILSDGRSKSCEFRLRGLSEPWKFCSIVSVEFCGRCWRTLSSWVSISERVGGLAPVVMMFLNQAAWNLGLPLFELPGESLPPLEPDVTPTRKRYATLLADTISVLACLNCNN